MKQDITEEWKLYEAGISYKQRIGLIDTVNKNERMFSGDQWSGVKSNGLPTPVFNVIRRVLQYKISSVMSNAVKINYSVDGIEDSADNPDKPELLLIAELLSKYSISTWERLKMDSSNETILRDAAISGDGITYFYFDANIDTGEEVKGDIAKDEIDNVNYIPGNPNDKRVQTQPYIIIPFRHMINDLKEEAKRNGMPQSEIDKITSDTETNNQAGDMAKIELDQSNKCICLLKMWKDPATGHVWFKKSTRSATIQKPTDSGLRRYPVAKMCWEERKNSCHGVSEVSGLIPNQIYINKIAAMLMLNTMYTAFPKLVYDSTVINEPNNTIGEAIAVQGSNGPIGNVAAYLNPGQASPDAYQMFLTAIEQTKEMMGANEAALGQVDPKNTSAIIAVQQAAAIPLESVKRRFYQYIEDVALIWIDFWTAKYNVQRNLTIQNGDNTEVIPFDGSQYKDVAFKVKIDVGPSSQWSEITALQTLDNLLTSQQINLVQYLERLPNGILPKKQELIDEIKAQQQMMAEQQAMMEQQAQEMAQQQMMMEQGY